MYASDDLSELGAALAKAQAEFKPVPKSKTGKVEGEGKRGHYEYSYKYADLADIVEMAAPVLGKYGLSVTQHPEVDANGNPILTTMLLHSSGQYMKSSMPLYIAKLDAQTQGSAITYARRYTYGATTGVVTDDDDDGHAATQSAREAPPARQQRPALKPVESAPEPPAVPLPAGWESAEDAQEARAFAHDLVKQAIAKNYFTKDKGNELWAAYGPRPTKAHHEEWFEALERTVALYEGSESLPDNPEPGTITNLQERATQVQGAQRTRAVPNTEP